MLPALTVAHAADPVRIDGPEQGRLIAERSDGGLPSVWGAQNFAVFRAARAEAPAGLSGTYNHHMDMAVWRGRLYLAWETGEKDEDTWPGHEVYSTSRDGATWTEPAELFPEGVGTPLRMYFFHAPNDRLLAIAGLRVDHEKLDEKTKGGIIVREIRADHTLGPVFTLRPAPSGGPAQPPALFTAAREEGFVTACRQLLANRVFLEQQDYGNLLDAPQRMTWNDPRHWGGAPEAPNFGKAFSFFHRRDGAIVGIAKNGFVTVSADEGTNWSRPVIPESLVTNNAKVWGQRLGDGRYALVYNPQKRPRFPLVVVTSDDGQVFRDMRVVHGVVPPQRYAGLNKNLGAQYVRGISEWSSDGSWPDATRALWLVYSSNKEDIWVSRVPLPLRAAATGPVVDDFARMTPGPFVPGWNTYAPKWGGVGVTDGRDDGARSLELSNADPFDQPRAARLFPAAKKITATVQINARQAGLHGGLGITLGSEFGGATPVRLRYLAAREIGRMGAGGTMLPAFSAGAKAGTPEWVTLEITADCGQRKFSVKIEGETCLADTAFDEPAENLSRLEFILFATSDASPTGPIDPAKDHPVARPAIYRLKNLHVDFTP